MPTKSKKKLYPHTPIPPEFWSVHTLQVPDIVLADGYRYVKLLFSENKKDVEPTKWGKINSAIELMYDRYNNQGIPPADNRSKEARILIELLYKGKDKKFWASESVIRNGISPHWKKIKQMISEKSLLKNI